MKRLGVLIILVFSCISMYGQGSYRPINLGGFDRKNYHFGFLLGFNSADFYVNRKGDPAAQDSLLTLNTGSTPGFNLGIIGSLNFTKNISVRFLPTLSFEDRVLNYVYRAGPDSTKAFEKRVESTYIDFPINFKFRTDRLRNIAPYALVGARYRINMQSEKDVKNEVADDILVKTKSNDFALEFGGGMDFFLPYFKFGIEVKMAMGLTNQLVPEDTQFSNPIQSLKSKTLLISLTFEG